MTPQKSTLSSLLDYLKRNTSRRLELLDIIKQDLGARELNNECSHMVDEVSDEIHNISFEDIVEAVINRVTAIIESYEEECENE